MNSRLPLRRDSNPDKDRNSADLSYQRPCLIAYRHKTVEEIIDGLVRVGLPVHKFKIRFAKKKVERPAAKFIAVARAPAI
jgi:hypothetical protein